MDTEYIEGIIMSITMKNGTTVRGAMNANTSASTPTPPPGQGSKDGWYIINQESFISKQTESGWETYSSEPDYPATLNRLEDQGDPFDVSGQTAIIGGRSGVVVATYDGGDTWSQLPVGLNSGTSSDQLRCLSTDGDGIWVAGFTNAYAARSVDNGVTWSALPRGLNAAPSNFVLFSISAGNDGVWVAGFSNGVMSRSTDNGATWTQLPQGGDGSSNVATLDVRSDNAGTWITARQGGGHHGAVSYNNGETWAALTPVGLNSGTIDGAAQTVCSDGKGKWFIGFSGGFTSMSVDNGVNWAATTLTGVGGNFLGSDTDGNGTWIASTSTGEIWESTDDMGTWTNISSTVGLDPDNTDVVAVRAPK